MFEKNSTIHIDRNGNLKLVVGPNAVQMQVDANALRRASKVFDRMLFGPFRESHQTANWTVELPEDDPEALRIILHAIHANFGNLPRDLALSKLYDLAMMADKYGVIGSLLPWGHCWTIWLGEKPSDQWRSKDKNETSYQDLQRLLILYHFGSFFQFKGFLTILVLKSNSSPTGQLLFKTAAGVDRAGSGSIPREWKDVGALPGKVIGELLIIFTQN